VLGASWLMGREKKERYLHGLMVKEWSPGLQQTSRSQKVAARTHGQSASL
jgi:hypothetical protein